MSTDYDSSSIEVLTGLEPVRKRPGMYTNTERPNHLVQEVVDNSVDEALAGHATKIDVVLYEDGSLSASDDGRGMPVDVHSEEGVPGVELILTRLHAGGKFSNVIRLTVINGDNARDVLRVINRFSPERLSLGWDIFVPAKPLNHFPHHQNRVAVILRQILNKAGDSGVHFRSA